MNTIKVSFKNSSSGIISTIQDNIVIVNGLNNVTVGELVNFLDPSDSTIQGYVMNIESDLVKIVLIKGSQKLLSQGQFAYRAYHLPTTKAGFGVLGQILSPLGVVINDSDFSMEDLVRIKTYATEIVPIFQVSAGIIERDPVARPFLTGITSIDCFLPIGCGQRELIIGDNNTGKTSLAVTILLNQRQVNNNYYSKWRSFEASSNFIRTSIFSDFAPCIYVFIGKKRSEGVRLKNVFLKRQTFNYMTFMFTSSDDLASIQYLAPYAGTALGEWFRDHGYHAAIVYDDLSEHAVAYRQISLLLRRPPGREAYPGDIFYLHSRLLERSAKMSKDYGGGSLTALPIIETQAGDVSAYIPTNVISITDGQIYLESDLFNKGIRPALNTGLSVSRVGSKAQIKAMKKVAGKIKLAMGQFSELEAFAQFGYDLDQETQKQLDLGRRLTEVLKQGQYEPMPVEQEVAILYAVNNGFLAEVKVEDVVNYEKNFLKYMTTTSDKVLEEIRETKELNEKIENELKSLISDFNNTSNYINKKESK